MAWHTSINRVKTNCKHWIMNLLDFRFYGRQYSITVSSYTRLVTIASLWSSCVLSCHGGSSLLTSRVPSSISLWPGLLLLCDASRRTHLRRQHHHAIIKILNGFGGAQLFDFLFFSPISQATSSRIKFLYSTYASVGAQLRWAGHIACAQWASGIQWKAFYF